MIRGAPYLPGSSRPTAVTRKHFQPSRLKLRYSCRNNASDTFPRSFCEGFPYSSLGIPPMPPRAQRAQAQPTPGKGRDLILLSHALRNRCPFVAPSSSRSIRTGTHARAISAVNSKALPGHQGPRQETCPKPPSERPRTSPIRGPHDYAQRDWVAPPNRKWQI